MHTIKAKAKINLFFQITGKRPDGYHLMESLVVFANDVYDLIEITPAVENSTSIKGGEFFKSLINEANLIDKALQFFSRDNKYHCQLTKDIPIGAGLGGGSSDAAMVAKFLKSGINNDLLSIGADLPICYHAEPAFCGGIGEIIEPIKIFPELHLVLVNPNKMLLTKDVFKNNTKINTPPIQNKRMNYSLEELIDFLKPLNNDLTDSAIQLMPEIQNILDLLSSQEGCCFSRMSGSGPTCFAVFKDKESAIKASANILTIQPNYWVKCSTA